MGLRFEAEVVEAIMGSFAELFEDSTTYQATLRKCEARGETRGRATAVQDTILKLARARFGLPSAEAVQRVRSTVDGAELAKRTDRLLTADGWDALLGG